MKYSLRMDFEQVTVPAGTFDSIKVTKTYDIEPPHPWAGVHTFTTWHVKNIGLVKRVQQDGTLWELKRYNSFTP